MNREIKFRAWDIQNNKWLNDDIRFQTKENNIYMSRMWDEKDVIKIVIQQFTGLHDINGKEIYEGDVLNFKTFSAKFGTIPDDGTKINFRVEWQESAFYVQYYWISSFTTAASAGHTPLYNFSKDNKIEVVGNIFENPELIKDKNEKQ